ncbi:MAG: hypothetical protein HY712_03250 [candidate division NC10 bacterium]|nr:hypothetical protein [candidate division NC10 bacterium]
MQTPVARKLEKLKPVMLRLGLSKRYASRQTAICLLALSDARERPGLLSGKVALRDGARIHDILEFARHDLGIRVAENTRESYRKGSLRPLYEVGFVTRHQLSVNDPNPFYRLHPDLLALVEGSKPRHELLERLTRRRGLLSKRTPGGRTARLRVRIAADTYFTLSGSEHNRLEKEIVEEFGPAFIPDPLLIFLGGWRKRWPERFAASSRR